MQEFKAVISKWNPGKKEWEIITDLCDWTLDKEAVNKIAEDYRKRYDTLPEAVGEISIGFQKRTTSGFLGGRNRI